MIRLFFQSIEDLAADDILPLDEVSAQLAFNEEGLIPVITQDDLGSAKQVMLCQY